MQIQREINEKEMMEHERREEERLVRETMQKMADEQALQDQLKA